MENLKRYIQAFVTIEIGAIGERSTEAFEAFCNSSSKTPATLVVTETVRHTFSSEATGKGKPEEKTTDFFYLDSLDKASQFGLLSASATTSTSASATADGSAMFGDSDGNGENSSSSDGNGENSSSSTETTRIRAVLCRAAVGAPIDAGRDVSEQVVAVSVPESLSQLRALDTVVSHVVAPMVSLFSVTQRAADRSELTESKLEKMTKRLNELSLSVSNFRQSVNVQRVELEMPAPETLSAKDVEAVIARGALALQDARLQGVGDRVFECVRGWQAQIQKLSEDPRIKEMPAEYTSTQEAGFWSEFTAEMRHIEAQLEAPERKRVLEALVVVRKVASRSLLEKIRLFMQVAPVAQRIKEFVDALPVGAICACTTFPELFDAVGAIPEVVKKREYPDVYTPRLGRLIYTMGNDVVRKAVELARGECIMVVSFDAFLQVRDDFAEAVHRFDAVMSRLKETSADLNLSISDSYEESTAIKARFAEIYDIRSACEDFKRALQAVFGGSSSSSSSGASVGLAERLVHEVEDAYGVFTEGYNVLRVPERFWKARVLQYDRRVGAVEQSVVLELQRALGVAKGPEEMFAVFNRFSKLITHQRIRNAVQEYQGQLIEIVKRRIRDLQQKVRAAEESFAQAQSLSAVRGIPGIFSRVYWNTRVIAQIETLFAKTSAVLGENWKDQPEGRVISDQGANLIMSLDPQTIVDNLIMSLDRSKFSVNKLIFAVRERQVSATGGEGSSSEDGGKQQQQQTVLSLEANYDTEALALVHELRNFKNIGVTVPSDFIGLSISCQSVCPLVTTLREVLKLFAAANRKLTDDIAPLVWNSKKNVTDKIREGADIAWSSRNAAERYIEELSAAVGKMSRDTDTVYAKRERIERLTDDLRKAPYEYEAFQRTIQGIQDEVDTLSSFSIARFVRSVNAAVSDILAQRLVDAVKVWIKRHDTDNNSSSSNNNNNKNSSGGTSEEGAAPQQQQQQQQQQEEDDSKTTYDEALYAPVKAGVFLCTVTAGRGGEGGIVVEPHIEATRAAYYSSLNGCLRVVLGQKTVGMVLKDSSSSSSSSSSGNNSGSSSSSSIAAAIRRTEAGTQQDLIDRFPGELLGRALGLIDRQFAAARRYAEGWVQYRKLWSVSAERVEGVIGRDVSKWSEVIKEVAQRRAEVTRPGVQRAFGQVVVNYKGAKKRIVDKYTEIFRELLGHFSTITREEAQRMQGELAETRRYLGEYSLSSAGTDDMIAFSDRSNEIKEVRDAAWARKLKVFMANKEMFTGQCAEWIWRVNEEYSLFQQDFADNQAKIEETKERLRTRVDGLHKDLDERLATLESEWQAKKPLDERINYKDALDVLAQFERHGAEAEARIAEIAKVRNVLSLDFSVARYEERLRAFKAEYADVSEVWGNLSVSWRDIDALGATRWADVDPRKVRRDLEGIKERLRGLPNRIRQYNLFTVIDRKIDVLLKSNLIIMDLHSEAIKPRHWEMLKKKLNAQSWVIVHGSGISSSNGNDSASGDIGTASGAGSDGSDGSGSCARITLAQVWAVGVVEHENTFREVITLAQGELGLEEFLKQVSEQWGKEQRLDLVNYQNKTMLIKNWDELFTKLSDNLTSLTAMRSSPYFTHFAEKATEWEGRLTRLQEVLEVMVDVQRKWVYLEGVFNSGGESAGLLPRETAKFRVVDKEFKEIMKRCCELDVALKVPAVEGIQRIPALADQLARIQKALGDYLEKQRASFPRFYFIGDEDLLEIIGNARDISKTQKHLKKMFAGVSALTLDPADPNVITGVQSSEGEAVPFAQHISLVASGTAGTPAAKWLSSDQWLTLVERYTREALAGFLTRAVAARRELAEASAGITREERQQRLLAWIEGTIGQLVIVSTEVLWCEAVERALQEVQQKDNSSSSAVEKVVEDVAAELEILADSVLQDLNPVTRKKCEHLMATLVHQRDVTRNLVRAKVQGGPQAFEWLYNLRYYYSGGSEKAADPLEALTLRIANAEFRYGWEYLGVSDFIVRTELIDKVYLTMTQALDAKMGANPFGPAGTGKTECVKALGSQLGKQVVVFCCDEGFSASSMSRILSGLCMCGAWGCFDEFNRLEERTLSAVSQQIQSIQEGISNGDASLDLGGGQRVERLDPSTGIFITMNPGYAGRSNLPDNLKQLFRPVAMITPDREAIAQVMLFSQGFRTAERLAAKVVPLFELCREQLSSQAHYDFGLRALKSVLVSAGNLKRKLIKKSEKDDSGSGSEKKGEDSDTTETQEQAVMIRSICETTVPKLVSEDIPLLYSLVQDVFPGADVNMLALQQLRKNIEGVCRERCLEPAREWTEKLVQLYQIQNIHHGLMLVGPAGTGKSAARDVLLAAMERLDGVSTVQHVIDPKAIVKDQLFGTLDPTTREWTDGLFTAILRRIITSNAELAEEVKEEEEKKKLAAHSEKMEEDEDEDEEELQQRHQRQRRVRRHWIVFDGDVDPEWVENLNSVLDDNKLLTLPNGERLALPRNVRIVFEVQDLKNATLATVSRCGMVWFSEGTVTPAMLAHQFLERLRAPPAVPGLKPPSRETLAIQRVCADALAPLFAADGLVERALTNAAERVHIMDFTKMRALSALLSLLRSGVASVVEHNGSLSAVPLSDYDIGAHIVCWAIFAIPWSLGGSLGLAEREDFSRYVYAEAAGGAEDIPLVRDHLPPVAEDSKQGQGQGHAHTRALLDYGVTLERPGTWFLWESVIPTVEVESHKVGSPDVVIPTVDTTRHAEVMRAWLADRKPLILCGPPGSGKTMTLQSTLGRMSTEIDVATLNFSSATTPDLLLKTFSRFCECKRVAGGETVLRPTSGHWLVVFCDEINLPQTDSYGTQRVITFMRQLIERNGYWRFTAHDKAWTWVRLENIQFVGACNPPTDPGRVPLSNRFLRHAPVVLVDFPSEASLHQIYGTFVRALTRLLPGPLRAVAPRMTDAMIDWYVRAQKRFTPDIQDHYVFSPRELSRWVRSLHEAFREERNEEEMDLEELVMLWAHEGLRLFSDRLAEESERLWTDALVRELVGKHFPEVAPAFEGVGAAAHNPLLFCNWLSKRYQRTTVAELRAYVKSKLPIFAEEELDVHLVLFDEVLEHILRIDRVFRQPQGHALLVGVSGGGKTVLSRFVAWKNALSIFSIKVNNKYRAVDFENDLRTVMKRSGCEDEKICFIFDESNALDSSFLEKMNTLLAGGEVPGLFEGDDWAALIRQCRDAVQRAGPARTGGLDSTSSDDELYRWFVGQVRRNLHVVFTLNPASPDFHNRAATSPALFNRCVIDWFGEWSPRALFQVGLEFTAQIDLDSAKYEAPDAPPADCPVQIETGRDVITHRQAVVATLVYAHLSIDAANARLLRLQGRHNYVTPRHYLDLISHFSRLVRSKRQELEEEQRHLNMGLDKLIETEAQVKALQDELRDKEVELRDKEREAGEKLSQMLQDQGTAEQKRKDSVLLQAKLAKQKEEIRVRKERAEHDLLRAEPALIEAKQAVDQIKKKNLDEVRALPNPPLMIKMTMECVTYMLSGKKKDWAAIRKSLAESGFIPSILNFNTDSLTERIRQTVRKDYMSDPKFTYDAVDRASKACGPLYKWIDAQVNYSEIKDRVEPLRREVEELQVTADRLQAEADELTVTVAKLEQSIEHYKAEYSALISDKTEIEREMRRVKAKVDRSTSLIANLSDERRRWEVERQTFEDHMETLVGNCLLCACALAYSGFFDQNFRVTLMRQWMGFAAAMGVRFRPDISLVDFLAGPEERLQWQANTLPADDLCAANAIMLQQFNRYPLIIDPSGQAFEFLGKQLRDKKVTVTSFLDSAFMKHLESALRFGTPLFVQDVETIDPVLNPVLNKEIQKKGGRVLIRLGDQEIDFSPSFAVYLFTRDPTAHFTPDLCSRVTLVNFTVTQSSLQEQCLHQIMSAEKPDEVRRMDDLMKMQGEFRVKLRTLQKSLLNKLSQTKGNILDDDRILETLETLKKEAGDVASQVASTEEVMREIELVSNTYKPMALACSRVYFAMEDLARVHFLYHFSLRVFLALFASVVAPADHAAQLCIAPRLADVAPDDTDARIAVLTDAVFQETFHRVCDTLLHEDHITFGLRAAAIRVRGTPDEIPEHDLDFLLKAGDLSAPRQAPCPALKAAALLSDAQWGMVAALADAIPAAFAGLDAHMAQHPDEWLRYLRLPGPEREPSPWAFPSGACESKVRAAFLSLLLIRVVRPDRFVFAVHGLLNAVFGDGFLQKGEPDLAHAAETAGPGTPLVLCSMPGYDASGKVAALAAAAKVKRLATFAIGSEGFDNVERTISDSSKTGAWVLLKNVHLAPQWLSQMEKKIHTLGTHPGCSPKFRLFMTSEVHPKLPANLLRLGHVVTFEPPPGVLASFRHALGRVAPERMDRAPRERSRLYFLVCWFHAIVMERLRYVPHGWTKAFEFGETDQRGALDTIDAWIDMCAEGRENIDPDRIPWVALRTLLAQSIYGGRVDNEFDQRTLRSLVDRIFVPESFDIAFPLLMAQPADSGASAAAAAAPAVVVAPEHTSHSDCLEWADSLSAVESPAWLGLPDDADLLLMANQTKRILRKVTTMQGSDDSDDVSNAKPATTTTTTTTTSSSGGGEEVAAWMKTLSEDAMRWLSQLPSPDTIKLKEDKQQQQPQPQDASKQQQQQQQDVVMRCLERDARALVRLLTTVRRDMQLVIDTAAGAVKQTNETRALFEDLSHGVIPHSWKPYALPEMLSLGAYVRDLARRVDHFCKILASSSSSSGRKVWLGGLLTPEAYITATRQAAARANKCSLETLSLQVVAVSSSADAASDHKLAPDEFAVEGLVLENALLGKDGSLHIPSNNNSNGDDSLSTEVATALFAWRDRSAALGDNAAVKIPVFLNETRMTRLFTVALPAATPDNAKWCQRSTAFVSWVSP